MAYGNLNVNISGNTSGATANINTGTLTIAGGNNITVSQNGNAITISGANAGGAQTAISGLSAGTTQMTSGTAVFSNSNGISFGVSGNTVTASYTVPSTAGLLSAINVSGGTTSNNLSAITFSNSNGLSFGLNGSVMTASHNGLTTARASNDAIGLNTAKTNVTWTVNSSGLSLDASGYAGTGVTTASTAGSDFAITHGTNGLSMGVPKYLTTAMQSNAVTISNINLSAGTTSTNASAFTFSNANNFTFGLGTGANVGVITASYTVPTVTNSSFSVQDSATTINPVARIAFSTGNNITLSLSTGASSVTVGVAHNLAGTSSGFGGNLISGSMTHNSSGLNLSLNHPAWLTTAMQSNAATISNINISAGTTSTNASAFTFNNANGITFGLGTGASVGSITASHNGLTTARASNDAIGLNTAQSNVTWTVNSSGLSLDARGYAGTTTAITGNASITLNSGGLQFNGSGLAGTTTAITGGALITMNSAGFRFDGGGLAGTASTFNGTNVSGSITLNSAGIRLDLSAQNAAAGNVTFSAGTTSSGLAAVTFSNSNGVSFGLGTGANAGVITASVNAGGGGVAIAASNTTFTSGTVQFNGSGALTVNSGVQAVNLSVPATSSMIGTNGISISTNGSTITVSNIGSTNDVYEPRPFMGSSVVSLGNSSIYMHPWVNVPTLTLSKFQFPLVMSTSSSGSASSYTAGLSFNIALYTRNATNATRLDTYFSTQYTSAFAVSSNASAVVSFTGGNTGSAGIVNLSGFNGGRINTIAMAVSLTQGEYYLAYQQMSAGATMAMRISNVILTANTNSTWGYVNQATASKVPLGVPGHGVFSAASAALPASIGMSEIQNGAQHWVYHNVDNYGTY